MHILFFGKKREKYEVETLVILCHGEKGGVSLFVMIGAETHWIG